MSRWLGCVVAGCVFFATSLLAFEVEATIKQVDAEKGLVVFTAGQQDRTVRVLKDVKVLDAAGKELVDRLKAKELKAGIEVTLTVERDGDRPVLKAIQLGRKSARPASPRVEA